MEGSPRRSLCRPLIAAWPVDAPFVDVHARIIDVFFDGCVVPLLTNFVGGGGRDRGRRRSSCRSGRSPGGWWKATQRGPVTDGEDGASGDASQPKPPRCNWSLLRMHQACYCFYKWSAYWWPHARSVFFWLASCRRRVLSEVANVLPSASCLRRVFQEVEDSVHPFHASHGRPAGRGRRRSARFANIGWRTISPLVPSMHRVTRCT